MNELTAVANGFKEWPSIEFPQFLLDLGFEDQSYHNDLCARAQRFLTPEAEEAGFPCLVVWCEHEKAEDREEFTGCRYFAVAYLTEGCGSGEGDKIYEGDDPFQCVDALCDWLANQPTTEAQLADAITRAKAEVLADVKSGTVPEDVDSFSTLHNYVDANGYGGAFEKNAVSPRHEFWDFVHGAVDRWIQSGEMRKAATSCNDCHKPLCPKCGDCHGDCFLAAPECPR